MLYYTYRTNRFQTIIIKDSDIVEKLFNIVGKESDRCEFSVNIIKCGQTISSKYEKLEFVFEELTDAYESADRVIEQISSIETHNEKFRIEERGMIADLVFENFNLLKAETENNNTLKVTFGNKDYMVDE